MIDPNNAGDCKAIGDVDGDGKPDLIVGGLDLVWYRNPDWQKFSIATSSTEFTTDCQARDVNADGRLDIVTADGPGGDNVIWFENRGAGAWARHVVGTHGSWTHDIEVSDFDGDGRLDILTHGRGFTHVWYQDGPDAWADRDLSATGKTYEGIGIGDVDSDGRIDFVQGGWWFKNPGGRSASWASNQFASGYDGGDYTAAVADLNGDLRPDVLVINQHSAGTFAWYGAPADPAQGTWTRNVIDDDIGAHKLNVVDLNNDGHPDLVAGLELAELRIYVNDGGPSPTFARQTINTTGCHNTRVGDVNGDRLPDILCVNYLGNPPVELWLSQPSAPLALDRWGYIAVDSARVRMASGFPAFGLESGDIDRDGLVDIVSGKYFYRNPGGDLTGSWSRVPFPVDADAMLVLDVDGDGQLDVVAQALPSVYWLKPDVDGSQWTAHVVASLTATSHTNGQGYGLAHIVDGSNQRQIVFTTGDGVWYLRIPPNPGTEQWPSVKIASGTSEDLLALGDIDGDDLDDVVASDGSNGTTVYWYRNPGTGSGNWAEHRVGDVTDWADRAALADINGDGRQDIVVAVENGAESGAVTYWFEAPQDRVNGTWTRRSIATQGSTNSMSAADMDGDGTTEVVTGEHRGQLRVRIWKTSDGGQTWQDTVVDSGKESHLGARVIDLDADGDLDIVSIAWDAYEFLHLWRNDAR